MIMYNVKHCRPLAYTPAAAQFTNSWKDEGLSQPACSARLISINWLHIGVGCVSTSAGTYWVWVRGKHEVTHVFQTSLWQMNEVHSFLYRYRLTWFWMQIPMHESAVYFTVFELSTYFCVVHWPWKGGGSLTRFVGVSVNVVSVPVPTLMPVFMSGIVSGACTLTRTPDAIDFPRSGHAASRIIFTKSFVKTTATKPKIFCIDIKMSTFLFDFLETPE